MSKLQTRLEGASTPSSNTRMRSTWSQRCRLLLRWMNRLALAFVAFVALYLLAAALLTLVPVNTDWQEPASGVEVFLDSNGFHVDFVVPMTNEVVDWRGWAKDDHFRQPLAAPSHIRFGWGDRGFFLEVPTISDLTPGVALRALCMLSTAAMHVSQVPVPPRPGPDTRRLVLTLDQYRQLAEHIQASFAKDANGQWRPITASGTPTGYWGDDTFYEATGRYSLVYTCNVWTNDGLKRMGVRTGLWTPFAPCVLWHR